MLGMGKWATHWPSDMSRRHTGQLNFLEFQFRIQPLWNIRLQGSTVTLGFQPSLSLLGCLGSRSLRQTAHSVGVSLPNFDMHASRCSRHTAARSLHSWDPLDCFESSCISRALHSGSKNVKLNKWVCRQLAVLQCTAREHQTQEVGPWSQSEMCKEHVAK